MCWRLLGLPVLGRGARCYMSLYWLPHLGLLCGDLPLSSSSAPQSVGVTQLHWVFLCSRGLVSILVEFTKMSQCCIKSLLCTLYSPVYYKC